jgi:hypothetical protein
MPLNRDTEAFLAGLLSETGREFSRSRERRTAREQELARETRAETRYKGRLAEERAFALAEEKRKRDDPAFQKALKRKQDIEEFKLLGRAMGDLSYHGKTDPRLFNAYLQKGIELNIFDPNMKFSSDGKKTGPPGTRESDYPLTTPFGEEIILPPQEERALMDFQQKAIRKRKLDEEMERQLREEGY